MNSARRHAKCAPTSRRLGHACADEGAAADALTELEREIDAPGAGLDRLRLVPTPFVPEVRLHLAEDAIVWWARMEAAAGRALPAPYWASAWAGGQALARHLLDHPELAAGRRVLDLAAGSGLVAIAAALAGAAEVIANDIDPYAVAAVTLNARANRVARRRQPGTTCSTATARTPTWWSPATSSTTARWPTGCCRSCGGPPPRAPTCWSATPAGVTCRRTA